MSVATSTAPADITSPGVSLYRAIWRWHFFAGLLVIPFLLNLAITGSIYLFKDEINDSLFAYRYHVNEDGRLFSPEKIAQIAVTAVPGSAVRSYKDPASRDRSAIVTVSTKAGSTFVFVNPHDGKVLDAVGSTEEFNYVVKRIHSLAIFGDFPNKLVEVTGGFAMVLVVTGIYLWWPRRQAGGIVTVRGTPAKRIFWRDTHAVTGAFAGLFIFFMAATGMPWSGYWGANVQAWLGSHGLGYPTQLWDDVPKSEKVTKDILPVVGWTVEQAPVPLSDIATALARKPIGLNNAVAVAKSVGLSPGFEIAVPSSEAGVYTAAIYPDDLSRERLIHIDQYSGKPLVDIAYGQYPALGKVIEWGINVHQGQQFGRFNQLLMLATCIAIILCCTTGIVMWWKRRPSGRMGVPPGPPRRSVYVGLWLIAGIFALAFPLTGIAIVTMIIIDLVVIKTIPPLRRAFG